MELRVKGLDRLLSLLGDLERRASREALRRASEPIHDALLEGVKSNFRAKSAAGAAWRPLRPDTRRSKVRAGWPPDVGVRTGEMKASLTSPAHPQHIYRVGDRGVVFGTSVPYAMYFDRWRPLLQFGDRTKRRIAWAIEKAVREIAEEEGR